MMTDDDNNWISIQLKRCSQSGAEINSPAKAATIKAVEEKLHYKFPTDFIDFYKQANGFVEWDFIGNMFSIWSLEKIAKEYDESDDFIAFCDHCIDLYRIGYLKSEVGVFKDFDDEKPIAKTFRETLELINSNSHLLY